MRSTSPTADLVGHLALFMTATSNGLRVELIAPIGQPADGSRVDLEGTRPDRSTFSLFPRPCGPGCFTVTTRWKPGTTALAVQATAPHLAGGTRTVAIVWPPGPDATDELARVVTAMRALSAVDIAEHVDSGPGSSDLSTGSVTLTGSRFMNQEPYGHGNATDVRRLPPAGGFERLTLSIPGSRMWQELVFDAEHRLRHQVIIDPGHRITRNFGYGSGGP